MNRIISFLSVFLFVSTSFASLEPGFKPEVGDRVVYRVSSGGREANIVQELAGILKGGYVLNTYELLEDGTKTLEKKRSEKKASLEKTYISNIQEFCGLQKDGKIARLSTEVGMMQTCFVANQVGRFSQRKWYAEDIPFGIVKFNVRDMVRGSRSESVIVSVERAGH